MGFFLQAAAPRPDMVYFPSAGAVSRAGDAPLHQTPRTLTKMNLDISQCCEFFMLFTFGFSWPFAIVKTYRAKRVEGKSPMFALLVILGYVGGVCARLLDGKPENDWLAFVYALDMALVATDLSLYFHYSRKNRLAGGR